LLAGVAVRWFWGKLGETFGRWFFLAVVIAIAAAAGHDVNRLVFKMPADEKNPYAYAQTSEDLLRLPARLEELVRQNGKPNPRIAVVAADPWPLPWYLRKFSQVGFWQPGQPAGAADFFITSTDAAEKMAGQLKNFRPEFFGVRPDALLILWAPLPPETKP
jgi:hypothetical protein